MNISHACRILRVARRHSTMPMIVRGRRCGYIVHEMSRLGLIDAILPDGRGQRLTAISGITAHGETFLRALVDQSYGCRAD